jgi:hypothetical protein
MAIKEPKIWRYIEFRDHMPLAMFSAISADFGDAIHHQHWGGWQLRIARPKQFTAGAFQQIIAVKAGWKVRHEVQFPDLFRILFLPLSPARHVLQAFGRP